MAQITISIKGNLADSMKALANDILRVKLSITNGEGKKISIPAICGILAFRFLPLLAFATLYSLISANLVLRIEKEI